MKTTLTNKNSGLKRTSLLRGIGLILLSFIVAGCPAGKTVTEEKVVIRGSNTIGEELAPRLIAEYKKEHSAVVFDLESKGTGYGLGNLLAGGCDIAAASRMVTTNEIAMARDRGIELNEYIIGDYSVAVIVNAGSLVGNLTQDQVRDIFTGAVQNWKDVGGPDAPIHLYIRDPISGTYLGFQELAMGNKPYALGLKTCTNYTVIAQAVAKDANGIGYSSIELASSPGVKGVSIGGAAPTIPSVNKGQYPYSRVLRFYTNKASEAATARNFIQFVQSPRGQQILTQMGFVPRP